MQESAHSFHHLEWPSPDSRVRGPLLCLRGWAVAKPGGALIDVRARIGDRVFLGVHGLPRADLATHFKTARSWLPAEFVVAVPVIDGAAEIAIEVLDLGGHWLPLAKLSCTVNPDGEADPRTSGEFHADNGWLTRSPHAPFHGHLDAPGSATRHGRAAIFGWLLHAEQAVAHVFASTDLLAFSFLDHGLVDESLAAKVPAMPQARQARLRGEVDAPATLCAPCCLRVYAQLADGSVHLCFARRFSPTPEAARLAPKLPTTIAMARAALTPLPSGRPRRLLLGTLNLHPDDATLRALDVGRQLVSTGRWVVRLVATADGPLRPTFEAAGICVQLVNPEKLFAAPDKTESDAALAALGRQIWWRHLDAAVVFDGLCAWLLTLAAREQVRAFADWPQTDAGAMPETQIPFLESIPVWHSDALPADSRAAARVALGVGNEVNLAVFPDGAESAHGARLALQAAARLALADSGAPWKLVLLDGRSSNAARLLRRDAELTALTNLTVLDDADLRWLVAADLVCHAGTTITKRTLVDAAALGRPLVLADTTGESWMPRAEVIKIASNNPLALASALIAQAADAGGAAQRALAARANIRAAHAPEKLLAAWQTALESAVAVTP